MASTSRPAIIALTETWLDCDVRECEVELPMYKLLRCDRSRHGGGVLLYVCEELPVAEYKCDEVEEFLHATVSTKSGLLWVGVCYRPPSAGSCLVSLESLLGRLDLSSHKRSLLVGDFNMDMLKKSDPLCLDLTGLTSSFGFTQLVCAPTRLTPTTASAIDYVYSSCAYLVSSLEVYPPFGSSDHCSIHLVLPLVRPCHRYPRRRIWLFRHADYEGMNDCLSSQLVVSDEDACGDINAIWKRFSERIRDAMLHFIPSKVVKIRRNLP